MGPDITFFYTKWVGKMHQTLDKLFNKHKINTKWIQLQGKKFPPEASCKKRKDRLKYVKNKWYWQRKQIPQTEDECDIIFSCHKYMD